MSGLRLAKIFQKDRDIVEAAVKRDGNALRYASDELKRDPSVVLLAVRNDSTALRWAKGLLESDAFDLEVEALRQLKKPDAEHGMRYLMQEGVRSYSPDVWVLGPQYRARMAVAVGNRLATPFSEGTLVCIVLRTSASEEENSLAVTVEIVFYATVEFPGLPKETTIENLAERVLQDYPTKQYARVLTFDGTTAVAVLPENGRSLVTTLVPAVRRLNRWTSKSRSRSLAEPRDTYRASEKS